MKNAIIDFLLAIVLITAFAFYQDRKLEYHNLRYVNINVANKTPTVISPPTKPLPDP